MLFAFKCQSMRRWHNWRCMVLYFFSEETVMVLSAKMKLKIFIAALVVVLIGIGGSIAYFNFYVKTPEYTLNAVQEAVENHDIDEFNKYVDVEKS